MAHYTNLSHDLIVHNIPENFSTSKLKITLEKVSGSDSIQKISKISQSCMKLTVEDLKARKALLLQKAVKLKFGTVTYILEIEEAYQRSSGDSSMDSDEYLYTAPSNQVKAILRHLANEKEHKNAIMANMKVVGGEIISLTEEYVQVKVKNSKFGDRWAEMCKQCIENFVERYESWSKKVDNCSHQDSKYYSSLQHQYKGRCFVKWYSSSSTIMVTGLKEIVGEAKAMIERRSQGNLHEQHMNPLVQPHTFEYHGEKPAIMRFVFRNKVHHSGLERCLQGRASAKIEQDVDKTLTVKVTPTNHVSVMLHMNHMQFESACKQMLKMFFSNFSAWKNTFDPEIMEAMRRKEPELFKTVRDQNVFKMWHMDSGVVDITGLTGAVEYHKKLVEEEVTAFCAQRHLPSGTKSTRIRRASSSSYSVEGMSGARTSEFNTERIPTAILKFVFNDSSSKQALESCCGNVATIKIFSDKGQIKIQMKSKQKNPQWADANGKVAAYLNNFCTKTVVHEKIKLETAQSTKATLFKKGPGVFVQVFKETNVKVTGLRDAVADRLKDIQHAVDSEEIEERLPADIYIAQRECKIWEKVEERCEGSVTILPFPKESKIVYMGQARDIISAKHSLGKLSQELVTKEVEGLSSQQLEFLKHCKQSQRDSLRTNESWLDPVYAEFRKSSVCGSLAFGDEDVQLICGNEIQWQRGNNILRDCIKEFFIDLNPFNITALSSAAQQKVNKLPVCVKHLVRRISVVCSKDQMNSMKVEMLGIIAGMKVETKFYPMPEMMAKHIKKFHKIDRVRTLEVCDGRPEYCLKVTLEKEDIDCVDMQFEDLKLEIGNVRERLEGYNLYEYLSSEGKYSVSAVENETQCSIFLEPLHKKRETVTVSVTIGDILDQTCDAIVISTGKSINFSGQVGQAFARKYGSMLQTIKCNMLSVVKDKLYIAKTQGLLKWKYLFFIVTPSKGQDLTSALLALLRRAEKKKVAVIALPAIGTGNLGLSQAGVSSCMRSAFEQFLEERPSYLKHIQVVLYDPGQFVAFQDLARTLRNEARSTGLTATMYGTDSGLKQAKLKLQDLRKKHVRSALISCDMAEEICYDKKVQISKVCHSNNVLLKWEHGKCQIEGVIEDVRAAEEQIKKTVQMEYPSCWQVMADGQKYVRVKLDKHSTEYASVEEKFLRSQPRCSQISKIERVQNPTLYKQFKVARDHLQKLPENARVSVTRRLFHGTMPENVDKICVSNFDRNFAGANGTTYGRGVYFHKHSQYSVGFCGHGQSKQMFLADVITGTYTLGHRSYKAAPARDSSLTLYDSLVNDKDNPSIFVVFPDSSAYPSYLITFV